MNFFAGVSASSSKESLYEPLVESLETQQAGGCVLAASPFPAMKARMRFSAFGYTALRDATSAKPAPSGEPFPLLADA